MLKFSVGAEAECENCEKKSSLVTTEVTSRDMDLFESVCEQLEQLSAEWEMDPEMKLCNECFQKKT